MDERLHFHRVRSKCSFKVSDITGFIFGGFGTRFWIFRKHICGMDTTDIINNLPFYCWECLTILTPGIDLNLVIKDEVDMNVILEFLTISLRSVDGQRNSALPYLSHFNQHIEPVWGAKTYGEAKQKQLEEAYSQETRMYLAVFKRFKLMRVRMKISYMALCKTMTAKELWLEAVLDAYKTRLNKGLIKKAFEQGSDDFFIDVLAGKADLKLIVWH